MPDKLSQSLKICLGTGIAALLIGLQNINEYTQQLESANPELNKEARFFNALAHCTGLPQFFAWERELPTTMGASWDNLLSPSEEQPIPEQSPDTTPPSEAISEQQPQEPEPQPEPTPEPAPEPTPEAPMRPTPSGIRRGPP